MSIKKSKALSYVELILVIGLIGVVASLTVVPFKRHSQRKELGHLAHKAYLTLEDAVDNAILTSGPIRNWGMSSSSTFCTVYLLPNMKYSSSNCAANPPYVVTKDNMKFSVRCEDTSARYCYIDVDVNNDLNPNKTGKDQFEFQISRTSVPDAKGLPIVYDAESVKPAGWGGADILMLNGWEFTDKLWDCDWSQESAYTNCK